jgi:hypothetical protein
MFWHGPRGPEVTLPDGYQSLADRMWAELIAASDAYFLRGETALAGDPRAPEFADDLVEKQFEYFDRYRDDSGAMSWGENSEKSLVYEFKALPLSMKRALCERIWAMCSEAGLDKDPQYAQSAEQARKYLSSS